MKTRLPFALSLLAIVASLGCNDEIKIENRTFRQLCEMSGGSIDQDNNKICKCQETKCAAGVVCISNGEYCADSEKKCNYGNKGLITCRIDETNVQLVSIKKCMPIDGNESNKNDDNYEYRLFSLSGDEQDKYNTMDASGACECLDKDEEGNCIRSVSCNQDLCGICFNGDKKCDNIDNVNGIYYCENGQWRSEKSCVNNYSCKGNECGDCFNGDKQCIAGSGNDNAYIQVCENGKWVTKDNCDTQSCDSTGKLCGLCHDKNNECVNNEVTKIGQLYVCRENSWISAPCSNNNSCKLENNAGLSIECGECVDGTKKCENTDNGSITSMCEKGVWKRSDSENENSCDAYGIEVGVCLDGKKTCIEGSEYLCEKGSWSKVKECDNSYSCKMTDDDEYDGYVCGECVNEAKRCENTENGSITVTCEAGEWGQTESGEISEFSCNADLIHVGICLNGKYKCEENADGSGNEYECVDGDWLKKAACENKASCMNIDLDSDDASKYDTTVGLKCGDCLNDAHQCVLDDDKYITQSCIDAQWITDKVIVVDDVGNETTEDKTCISCNAAKTGCGECEDDKKTCKEGYEYVCKNGEWVTPEMCHNNYSCRDLNTVVDADIMNIYFEKICGECYDSDQKCIEGSGDENAKTYTCKNGLWIEDEVKCTTKACTANGKFCATCDENDTRCISGPNKEGVYYQCVGKTWTEALLCSNGVSCTSNASCGVCKDGTSSCINNIDSLVGSKKMCNKGDWETTDITCPNNSSCNATMTDCGECTNGASKCENGYMHTCVAGSWHMVSACPNLTCNGAVCADIKCFNDDTRCINNGTSLTGSIQKCSSGVWSTTDSCSDNSCNATMTDCGECKNGESKCESGYMHTCVAGSWHKVSACPNLTCNDAVCADIKCFNDDTRCINNATSLIGSIQKCSSESWGGDTPCSDNHSCNAAMADCGECRNEDLKCDNNTQYKCVNGQWNFNQLCPNGCASVSGEGISKECATCTVENATECVGSNAQRTCVEGKWQYMVCPSGVCEANSCKPIDSSSITAHNLNCDSSNEGVKKCDLYASSDKNKIALFTCINGTWSREEGDGYSNATCHQKFNCDVVLCVYQQIN